VLIAVGRDETLAEFRTEFLRMITPSLAGLVELDLRCEVTGSSPSLGDDHRHATIRFDLGPRRSLDRESAEALRNWSAQLRRRTRDERSRLRGRREELRSLREGLAAARVGRASR